jgi:hypothetical protein
LSQLLRSIAAQQRDVPFLERHLAYMLPWLREDRTGRYKVASG